jgi:hypothetical protein
MIMEREGYRECIGILTERGYPTLMRQKDAAKALGISERHIRDLIREGKIRACGAMIPIGAVAKIMCG